MPPNRPEIAFVVKGVFPSVAIDGMEETKSEVNFESISEGIVGGNVVQSGLALNKLLKIVVIAR